MSLRDTLSMYWLTIQGNLFPWLEEEIGPLTKKQKQLVTVLEMEIAKSGDTIPIKFIAIREIGMVSPDFRLRDYKLDYGFTKEIGKVSPDSVRKSRDTIPI